MAAAAVPDLVVAVVVDVEGIKMINKIIIVFGVLCALVVSGCSITGGSVINNGTDNLAKCLTQKGAVMYGTEWCSHCQNQKKLFGADFQYVNYVDCDLNSGKCDAAGIRGYPTWQINGRDYPGEQSLSKLKTLTGC